jgi:capsid portal protein
MAISLRLYVDDLKRLQQAMKSPEMNENVARLLLLRAYDHVAENLSSE